MGRSLFDMDEPTQADRLAPLLKSFAERGVFFGTSSWKYEGWIGSIYDRDRYLTRNKFSRTKFEAECLREYASTFPIVGGDFSFYQFPRPELWAKLFEALHPASASGSRFRSPSRLRAWPNHARYGGHAGTSNDGFLDAQLLEAEFLGKLKPYREQVAVLMFEFGTFAKTDFPSPEVFCSRLEGFLGSLPRGWRYAVEIRNPEYLGPGYFSVLARHNVAHVFNAWTRMPTLANQIAMSEAFTADFTVTRALLRRGRTYDQAVELFKPYQEVRQPDEPTRAALCDIARQALKKRQRAYVFVNNRLEGNAPSTIEAVVSALST